MLEFLNEIAISAYWSGKDALPLILNALNVYAPFFKVSPVVTAVITFPALFDFPFNFIISFVKVVFTLTPVLSAKLDVSNWLFL